MHAICHFKVHAQINMPQNIQAIHLLVGLTTHSFKKRLKVHFTEAILNQPSVILLDDLDHTMPQVSDAQELVGGEGNSSIRKSQGVASHNVFVLYINWYILVSCHQSWKHIAKKMKQRWLVLIA